MTYYQNMIHVMNVKNYLQYMYAALACGDKQDVLNPVRAASQCPGIVWG